jgi:lipocalin
MKYKFLTNFFGVLFGNKIKTVTDIDLNLYTGKWYQIATSRSTKLFGTGVNFKNVSAEYYCIDNCSSNVITVFNQGINYANNYTYINGFSYSKNISEPSKRKVIFEGVKFEGNYWIVKLGPIIENKYDYAIVSGPLSNNFATRFSLYVLCRNKSRYKKLYDKEVRNWCKENGFKFWWNKYIETK